MKVLIFGLIFVLVFSFASAVETPHTPEVITARGMTTVPVSFFNSDSAQTYTAVLEKNSPAVGLEGNSIYVNDQEFGSFNVIIGENDLEKGVYFDNLIISNSEGVFQTIPLIIGSESRISQIEYDVSIDFDPNSDIDLIAGEFVLSPTINVYKLNFNNPNSNGVSLKFSVYSIDGDILYESQEAASISRQVSFERFFNLGSNPPEEVLIVVEAERANSLGLDLYQVSINSLMLSPPSGKDYPTIIYISVFVFLLSSIILVSYLWYSHSANQAKDWMGQIDHLKKIKFSSAAKGLRKLSAQKSVLERAYSSHYITKNSFDSAITELDKLSAKLKKRL